MRILYVNGKPLSLWQRMIAALIAVVSLAFFMFFGVFILMGMLILGLISYGIFWWKFRDVRKKMSSKTEFDQWFSSSNSKSSPQDQGQTIEGEFSEVKSGK